MIITSEDDPTEVLVNIPMLGTDQDPPQSAQTIARVANLELARANLAAALVTIMADPNKMRRYNVDGQMFDRVGVLRFLKDWLKVLDDAVQRQGPVKIRWLGVKC